LDYSAFFGDSFEGSFLILFSVSFLSLRSFSFHSSVEARRDIGGEAKFHFLSVVLISLPDFVPMLYVQVYFLFLSFLPILFGFGESLTKKNTFSPSDLA